MAFGDITGAYVACAIRNKRPDIDLIALYDPREDAGAFLKGASARMENMGVSQYVTVAPVETAGECDYYRLASRYGEADLALDLGEKGLDTRLLFFTVLDGLFQRSFVLDILRDYIDYIPEDVRSVKLALPGYSYRSEDFEYMLEERGIAVVDPLDDWLRTIPRADGEGEMRFYWTSRNFPLENRMEEIFQRPVCFRTYYRHPWLRGECQKK
nr:hypothetical protein [Peptoniphilus sp.]